MRTTISLCFGALLIAVSNVSAQLPAGTQIALASLTPNGVYYFDRNLSGSSLLGSLPLTNTAGLDAIEASRDNRSLVATDTTGVWVIDQATSLRTFVTFTGAGTANWGCHGERDDFFTFGASGQVHRHDQNYLNGTLFATAGTGLLNSGCWDGSTGGVVGAGFSGSSPVHFIDANGVVTQSVSLGGVSSLSGCDWNPFDGSIMVSRFGSPSSPSLWRIDRSFTATTVAKPGPAFIQTANSIEVRETGPEEYLVTEYGSAPRHLAIVDPQGNSTQLAATSTTWGPADACYIGARKLWPAGSWTSGQTGNFYFNDPANPGDSFRLAASLSHAPGIPVGGFGEVHLAPDNLFSLSIQGAGIFNNFAGQLNNAGGPIAPPFVRIPAGLGGLGLRVYFGGVTFNGGGITGVTNACGVTIR